MTKPKKHCLKCRRGGILVTFDDIIDKIIIEACNRCKIYKSDVAAWKHLQPK